MAHKRLHFHAEAREKVLHGAQALADAVRVTLGPKSKSVLVERKYGAPLVCNDGVTIVKQLDLEDAEENLGVQVLRQAAERTGEVVGDGTTTSTLLACALFADGVRNIAAGASAVDIKRGFERGVRVAMASIREQSRPVTTKREKAQVAAVSAHNDTSIGDIVADAIERVAPKAPSRWKKRKGSRHRSKLSRACNSIEGFCRPISSRIPRAWKRSSKTRPCSSSTIRSVR